MATQQDCWESGQFQCWENLQRTSQRKLPSRLLMEQSGEGLGLVLSAVKFSMGHTDFSFLFWVSGWLSRWLEHRKRASKEGSGWEKQSGVKVSRSRLRPGARRTPPQNLQRTFHKHTDSWCRKRSPGLEGGRPCFCRWPPEWPWASQFHSLGLSFLLITGHVSLDPIVMT